MAGDGPKSAIEAFAKSHDLSYAANADLPRLGDLLSEDSRDPGAGATGGLPGGIEGTLAHYTYIRTSTDSDGHTSHETRRFTVVVTSVPESIGFAPSLGFRGSASNVSADMGQGDMEGYDLGDDAGLKGSHAMVYKGTSKDWLTQLFSPALIDFLARSDDDFGFELTNGILCVAHGDHLPDQTKLEALCEDAGHLAGAIRQESLEEVQTGGAEKEAARNPDADDPKMEAALGAVAIDSPANPAAARGAFSSHIARSPMTLLLALRSGIGWTLLLNIPGIALPIVFLSEGIIVPLIVIEGATILLITLFSYRRRVRQGSEKYAGEAFYRAYAKDRGLEIEEPLHFAATHAEAKLPFKPDRVFSGALPGGTNGSLLLLGDGMKRADRIALVAGPSGPVVSDELKTNPPGLSPKDLDGYAEQLSVELKKIKG